MVERVETAIVRLWGKNIGAVSWLTERGYAVFEYEPDFLLSGIELSPIHMGLTEARQKNAIFSFPALNRDTFLGLPGLLADSLPDTFGNHIIDTWLARNGRDLNSFSPVERLCYTGKRAMGAPEFLPPVQQNFDKAVALEIGELTRLAAQITASRSRIAVNFGANERLNSEALLDILRVGTSAGGARAKAIIAMDNQGNVISGQGDVPAGYDHWILKFDGVNDLELGSPGQFGRIEYGYFLMARAAGITMSECRLLEEHGRAHFLTKRFDRQAGRKIHMQTLCGLAHFDFNMAGSYSYEQAFSVMRRLRLSKSEALEQYRRMVFNVLSRNQDDHTKNISFLLDRDGKWHLSPAYDVTYSHNPAGIWTSRHQMSINGKRDNFTKEDLLTIGKGISLAKPDVIIQEVGDAIQDWPQFAQEAGVDTSISKEIGRNHRVESI